MDQTEHEIIDKKDLDEFYALLDEIQKAYNKDLTNLALCDDLKYLQWQICLRKFHEEMQSQLGDRTFDYLTYERLLKFYTPLNLKVGYALYGEPCKNGHELYSKEEIMNIKNICSKIQEKSAKFNDDGTIYLSTIFIPCFPNNGTDVLEMRVLFIVGTANSTDIRIIIEKNKNLKVYKSWQNFKSDNPFSKYFYALPKDGKYQAGTDGSPLLEFKKIPTENLATKASNVIVNSSNGITVAAAAFGIASIFVPVLAPVAVGAAAVSTVAKMQKRSSDKNILQAQINQIKNDTVDGNLERFVIAHNAPSKLSLSRPTSEEPNILLLEKLSKIIELIRDFKISDNSLNVSKKHRELLDKTMYLIHHSSLETLEDTERVQFTSYVLFFFNVLIIDHKAYVDKFVGKFKETITSILLGKTENDMNEKHEPTQYLKLEKSDETSIMIDNLMKDITKVDFKMETSEISHTLEVFGFQSSDQNSESYEKSSEVDQHISYITKAQSTLNTDYPKDENLVEWDVEQEVYVQLREAAQKKSNIIDSKLIDYPPENKSDDGHNESETEHEVAEKSHFNNWGVKCVVAGLVVAGVFVVGKYYIKRIGTH